jgi:ubiquinone/menaquinone biosynthesis C-methylase UbiE
MIPTTLKDRWADVDGSGRAETYVALLNRARPGDDPSTYPATLAWIDPQPGERILEVGCGNGAVARAVARHVPAIRELVATDASAAMIAEARRRSRDVDAPLRFEQADAARLPFPDGAFDRAYAVETFVILPDPHAALLEMGRVTRSGGSICVRESDVEAHALLASDLALERRLMRFVADEEYNGAIARQVIGWCKELGWTVEAVPAVETSEDGGFLLAELLPEWIADAQAAGVMTAEEGELFMADVRERQERGLFLSYTVNFRMRARKPV